MYPTGSEERMNSISVASGGGISGGYRVTTSPAPPSGRVGEAFAVTAKLIEAIHQEISGLEQRLSAVLRPPMPSPTGSGVDKANREPSPFANGIEQANAQLHQAVEYLRTIAARIDL